MPAKFYINPQNLRGGGGISIFKFTAAKGREINLVSPLAYPSKIKKYYLKSICYKFNFIIFTVILLSPAVLKITSTRI